MGQSRLPDGRQARIIDLPGTYSLNTTSLDESVAVEILLNKRSSDHPDLVVVVADVENLKRNLLLFTQIKDLRIPALLVVNMADRMDRRGISVDIPALEARLDTRIALVSVRTGKGVAQLKALIQEHERLGTEPILNASEIDPAYFDRLRKTFPNQELYKLWLVITQDVNFMPIEKNAPEGVSDFRTKTKAELKRMQHKETVRRYRFINEVLSETYRIDRDRATGTSERLDRILTHKVYGYLIFFAILMLIFQTIYTWSQVPQDAIDGWFASAAEWLKTTLPSGVFTDLLAEGVLAGIGGVVIFIPQIALLFFFIAILEETGYMSRVVFLMDRLLRPFGLSGKSVVPLMSGNACAIPAVMATRNIESWKERLVTILVVPFTTCSARLPIYLIIISLVIPDRSVFGVGFQALALMALYLIGFGAALIAAWVLHRRLKIPGRSDFVIEMPDYRRPMVKNVAFTVWEKTKSFVVGAGQIILALSIILWFLGSNGAGPEFRDAERLVNERIEREGLSPYSRNYIASSLEVYRASRPVEVRGASDRPSPAQMRDSLRMVQGYLMERARAQEVASHRLEHSYMGYLGKAIEPVVEPLGYDWKIGIAVLTSFAAREVFVGTLATIYSVGSDEETTIRRRMGAERKADGSGPRFDLATGVSLLLFYAFAMQCMSTLAIVKRETNSWKWPILQLVAMSAIAYLVAFAAYQILKDL